MLAFPSQEFGGQELKTDADVLDFARANGPPNLIVLTVGDLASRPGWWQESQPTWNFKGKWVVDKEGNRMAVDDKTLMDTLERLV